MLQNKGQQLQQLMFVLPVIDSTSTWFVEKFDQRQYQHEFPLYQEILRGAHTSWSDLILFW